MPHLYMPPRADRHPWAAPHPTTTTWPAHCSCQQGLHVQAFADHLKARAESRPGQQHWEGAQTVSSQHCAREGKGALSTLSRLCRFQRKNPSTLSHPKREQKEWSTYTHKKCLRKPLYIQQGWQKVFLSFRQSVETARGDSVFKCKDSSVRLQGT